MRCGTWGLLVCAGSVATALGLAAPADAQVERVVVKVAEARCFS